MKATKTTVDWDSAKNQWHVRVQIGEEVINRHLTDLDQKADEGTLKQRAADVAKDEGYDVDLSQVAVER